MAHYVIHRGSVKIEIVTALVFKRIGCDQDMFTHRVEENCREYKRQLATVSSSQDVYSPGLQTISVHFNAHSTSSEPTDECNGQNLALHENHSV